MNREIVLPKPDPRDLATLDWQIDEYGCYVVDAGEAHIWIQARPSYCDRGRWLAHVECSGNLRLAFDAQDRWPRYYFDLGRALLECEAWLRERKQIP